MILINALKKYSALDSKQKDFIKGGQRIFLSPPAEIIKTLQPLASFDKDCDAARRQSGWLAFFAFLSGVAILLIKSTETPVPFFETFVIAICCLFFFFMILYWYFKSIDINNRLREFAVPVLNTISQDMEKAEKMKVKLDLRGQTISAKRTKAENNDPGWFSYPKVQRYFYRDSWFDGSAVLCDGSRLFFSVTDFVTMTTRQKKNPRGKVKSKTKYKVKSKIKVGLALKNKDYVFSTDPSITSAGDRIKQKKGDRKNIISLTRVEVSNSLEKTLEPVSMLALIGKILMSAKPAGKAG